MGKKKQVSEEMNDFNQSIITNIIIFIAQVFQLKVAGTVTKQKSIYFSLPVWFFCWKSPVQSQLLLMPMFLFIKCFTSVP